MTKLQQMVLNRVKGAKTDEERAYASLDAVRAWYCINGHFGDSYVIDRENPPLSLTVKPENNRPENMEGDAHELWALAQLLPGEGITDGVDRIISFLSSLKSK